MRRTTVLFAVAILMPSLLLGALALRSARHQQLIIEQATDLYQARTDRVADELRAGLEARLREFESRIEARLADRPATTVATGFDETVRGFWPEAEMGFAVTLTGDLVSPRRGDSRAVAFLAEHEGFLTNRDRVDFFQSVQNTYSPQGNQQMVQKGRQQGGFARIIEPSKVRAGQAADNAPDSPPLPFQEIVANASSGTLTRFVGDELELLFWKRAAGDSDIVFGASLRPGTTDELWSGALDAPELRDDAFCLALLDEKARPVLRTDAAFEADWKHPFVATEIGESLPYWEAALYLKHPESLGRDTRVAQLSLLLMIVLALGVIVGGSILLARDTQRRLDWARARSDFVSNVSHELKTPLTSIRMFADLLERQDGANSDKAREYVGVIRDESERLSRLVDNVLDFDRLQRGERAVAVAPLDAHPVLRRVFETAVQPLSGRGFDVNWEAADPPYIVSGDADAISQILINLVSNAEKYCDATKELLLESELNGGELVVRVLDRGPGVSPENVDKLFDAFFRQKDGRAVSGSGLGLHIARQLAQAQGGNLTYRPRPGGGSVFSLHLPAAPTESS